MMFLAQPATGQYVQAGEVLIAGQPVTITAPGADTLVITYRPGSNISQVKRISLTETGYTWTPHTAGITALSTPGGAAQTVSVRFNRLPLPGLIVFIIAGTILFGGAALASVKLFGKGTPEMFTDRPDT